MVAGLRSTAHASSSAQSGYYHIALQEFHQCLVAYHNLDSAPAARTTALFRRDMTSIMVSLARAAAKAEPEAPEPRTHLSLDALVQQLASIA